MIASCCSAEALQMDVLILSRNVAIYSTRRLTEAFRSRGRQVAVLDPASICLSADSSGLGISAAGVILDEPTVVVPRIGAAVTDHAVAVLRHLEALGTPLTAPSGAVRKARDKMACLQVLAAAGLPIPKTVLARQAQDAAWAVEAVGGPPVVLKLLSGTHGVGIILAESLDSARSILESLWGLERDVLVQRFEASAAGRDLRLFVVGSEVVAAIRRRGPPGSFRSNLHHGGRAEVVSPDPSVLELAVRASTLLGLSVAGVDLLETDAGPLVTEVNASPGLEGVEDATGIDIAGAVADEALRIAGCGD